MPVIFSTFVFARFHLAIHPQIWHKIDNKSVHPTTLHLHGPAQAKEYIKKETLVLRLLQSLLQEYSQDVGQQPQAKTLN